MFLCIFRWSLIDKVENMMQSLFNVLISRKRPRSFWRTDCSETAITPDNKLFQISYMEKVVVCYNYTTPPFSQYVLPTRTRSKTWLTIGRQWICSGFLLIAACLETKRTCARIQAYLARRLVTVVYEKNKKYPKEGYGEPNKRYTMEIRHKTCSWMV